MFKNLKSEPTSPTASVSPSKPRTTESILDLPISKGKREVSLSAFSFLFSEIVQYNQGRVGTYAELEQKLADTGYDIGYRMNELCVFRDKNPKREQKIVDQLRFITNVIWKTLYGKTADELQKTPNMDSQYMIYETLPLESRFISLARGMTNLHCSYFTAGVIKGVLVASGFPATVRVAMTENKDYTVFVIDFERAVVDREATSQVK